MNDAITILIAIISTGGAAIALYLFFQEQLEQLRLKFRGGVPKGFLIFITGTNGVGKSKIAEVVANKLGIKSVVEVDDMREALRSRHDLFVGASAVDEYNLLSVSSYLSDSLQLGQSDGDVSNYRRQCELMTETILAVALRKQGHNISAVFEGINILPTELLKKDIPAKFVLFVNLKVKPPEKLEKRLLMKTQDIIKRDNYSRNLNKIMETSHQIDDDFREIPESVNDFIKIHKQTLYNDGTVNYTARSIVKKVRAIVKENR